MLTVTSPDAVPPGLGDAVVTIGKFDGVHAGHRAVLARLRELAAERGLTPTVVTFDRHPLSLLAPERCPPPLMSNAQRLDALAAEGVATTLMITFDRAFSALPAEEFVRRVLVDALHTRVLLVGGDFRFGAGGAGDVPLLQRLGAEFGFEVEVLGEVLDHGQRISSTRIRSLLAEGDVTDAAELLGGLHRIRSTVVHGHARGRTLGYPTANLSPQIEGFIPRDGVYAAFLLAGGREYPAAVSIGNNPTFEGIPDQTVEAHAIDAHFDLYDATVELAFVQYVRPMHKFPDAESLAVQMGHDERVIRGILGVDAAHA